MNVQDFPRPSDDRTGLALVVAAASLLAERRRDIPRDFLAALYGYATPEDLARYRAEELAAIAEQSWSLLAKRKRGAPNIRFEPAPLTPSVAVLEIDNDDMPFLVDSVLGGLNERGLDVRLLVHPLFTIERDAAGNLLAFKGTRKADGGRESFIHIHVEGMADAAQRAEIVRALEEVLADVRTCVEDWRPMLARVGEIIAELRANPPPLAADEIAEAIQFLEWMAGDNFTLLGVRDYAFSAGEDALEPMFETGLGLLRAHEMRLLRRGQELVIFTPEILEFLREPKLLIVTKAAVRSRVHRRVHLDYVGVKRFDRDGKLVGECRLCGLFTSTAYTRSARTIPYLRRKVDNVIRRAGFDPESFGQGAGQCAGEISARRIVPDRRRHATSSRWRSCSSTSVRACACCRGRTASTVSCRSSSTFRAIATTARPGRRSASISPPCSRDGCAPSIRFSRKARWCASTSSSDATRARRRSLDRAELDRAVEAIVRSWTDGLHEALAAGPRGGQATALFARYRDAFPIDYREVYPPPTALADIGLLEALTFEGPLGVELYRHAGEGPASAGLKVFSHSRPIPLSERVPVLENMGFRVVDERTYHIRPEGTADVWFHDMTLESALGQPFELAALRERLEACFLAVMEGAPRMMATTRSCWRPGSPGATWR